MRLAVVDQNDKSTVGYEVLPLNSIRPGFRYIMLKVRPNCECCCHLNMRVYFSLSLNVSVRLDFVQFLEKACSKLSMQGANNELASLFVRIDINIYVPDEHADFIMRLQNPTVCRFAFLNDSVTSATTLFHLLLT